MPVIVIGADTRLGGAVVDALLARDGEVRAFVSDPDVGIALKDRGVKVATGDVSDGSHVASASLNAFSAVVVPEAAFDDRERSFAADPAAVLDTWAEALVEAAVHRVIWLEDHRSTGAAEVLLRPVPELARVTTAGEDIADVAAEVLRLDEVAHLNG